jgi:hypothetical protein
MTGTYLVKRRAEPDFGDQVTAERDRDRIKFLYKIALDLRRAIANFDELRAHFATSHYSKFLEDA